MVRKSLFFYMAVVSLTALPSHAGETHVENSYRIRSLTNGWFDSSFNLHEAYTGYHNADTSVTKSETGFTSISGSRKSSALQEFEAFEVHSSAATWGRGFFEKNTAVEASEAYNFTGFDQQHQTTSGFSF